MRKNILIVAIAVAAVLGGCAKPPQEDISAVQASLDKARLAEADQYAPEALQKAEDALSSAMTEVDAQQARFALMRSFGHAKELLATAKNEADSAVTAAETGKEAARREVEVLIRETQQAIEEAKVALQTAPTGKGTRAEIDAMKAELETLGTGLTEVQAAYENGRYMDAKTKALAVKDKAGAISADIAQAKAKRRAT